MDSRQYGEQGTPPMELIGMGEVGRETSGRVRWTAILIAITAVFATVVLLVAGLAVPGAAQTPCDVTVAEGTSIQNGIDQAATGETVCVESGTYNESLTIDRGLEVRASDPAAPPVLDSNETKALAIQVTNTSNVTIDGLEIRNYSEYGVTVHRSDNFTIRNSEVSAIDGVTTFGHEAAVTLVDADDAVVEANNVHDTDIQAVNATRSQRLHVHDNEFHDNYEGISLTHSHDGVVTENNVSKNTGTLDGSHGIQLSNADRATIENNTLREGEQGILVSGSSLDNLGSENAVVRHNNVTDNTFGIETYRSQDGLIVDNRIVDNDIGAYVADGSNNVSVANNWIAENVGGVNIENATNVSVRANSIVENTGLGTGDAADGIAGVGVAESETPVIEDNEFVGPSYNRYGATGEKAITFVYRIEKQYPEGGPTRGAIVRNNSFSSYAIDVNLRYAIDATVEDNEMTSGVQLQGSNNRENDSPYFRHSFENNLVGGEPIHHVNGTSGETIQADGGQVLVTHASDVTVEGGTFEDVVSGIQIAHSDNVTVRGVGIHNTSQDVFEEAEYAGHHTAGLTVWQADDVTVENTTVTDPRNFGIAFAVSNGSTVRNSTVRGTVEPEAPRYEPASVLLYRTPSATVTNNTIVDGMAGVTVHHPPIGNLTITHNWIRNQTGPDAYSIGVFGDTDNETIAFNTFEDNDEGLEYEGSGSLNATRNWWGHHTGPSSIGFSDEEDPLTGEPADGDGDSVSENVRFDPWLDGPLYGSYFLVTIDETNGPVTAGETFTANVTIENRGTQADTQTLVLEAFDGTQAATETISLDAHENGTGTITWQPNMSHAGSGNVTVRSADTAAETSVTIYSTSTDGCDAVVTDGESVQSAVDDAAAGDEICVDVGTYSEHVRIDDSLTLRALSAAHSPVLDGSNADTIGINVTDATEVHLKGLTVSGYENEGVLVDNGTDVAITNLTIEDLDTFDSAIQLTDATNVTVSDSTLRRNGDVGVAAMSSTNVTISRTRLTDNDDTAVEVADSANVTVSDSTIQNTADAGISVMYTSNVTLLANQITNNAAEGVVVEDWGETHIEDNVITGNVDEGLWIDSNYFADVDVTVRRNELRNNSVGLLVEDDDAPIEWVAVTQNRIVNNTDGLVLDAPTAVLDATDNWWGDASGPSGNVSDPVTGTIANGTGNSVTQNVSFDPWLTVIEPTAMFAYSPAEPTLGDEVTFDASNASSPNGDIVEYRWDFTDDGTVDETTTNPVTNHSFGTVNTFDVTLTVEDDVGQTASVNRPVTVAEDQSASTPTPMPTETPTPTPTSTATETATPTSTATDDPTPSQTVTDTEESDEDGSFIGADGNGFGGLVALLALLTTALLASRRRAS